MGTRADFYIGTGKNAEWIGSISFDGYPDGNPQQVIKARSEKVFREEVEYLLSDPDVLSTRPEEGWPWPWEDSRTTDYAYLWCEDGKVRLSCFGRSLETPEEHEQRMANDDNWKDLPKTTANNWPDMSKRQMKHDDLMAKSGLLILGVK